MREVRKAKVTEAQAIIDLHADTIRKINSRDYSQAQVEMWIGTRSIEITQSMIENGEYCVCVDHTGNLLGQGHLKENEIFGLYVSADHQSQGIGSDILEYMEKEAREAGIKELHSQSTITALGFYKKHGYEELDHVKLGKARLYAINIKKRLD